MIHHPDRGTFPSTATLITGQVGQFWKAHPGNFSKAPKRHTPEPVVCELLRSTNTVSSSCSNFYRCILILSRSFQLRFRPPLSISWPRPLICSAVIPGIPSLFKRARMANKRDGR
jgi:hypothetical protein